MTALELFEASVEAEADAQATRDNAVRAAQEQVSRELASLESR